MTGQGSAELCHTQPCPNCRVPLLVPLASCRLESSPWRLEWLCASCSQLARVRISRNLVPFIRDYDRPGGTGVSRREVRAFIRDLDMIEVAVEAELDA